MTNDTSKKRGPRLSQRPADEGWRRRLYDIIFEADDHAGKWFDIGLLLAIYMHIWLPLVLCVLGFNSLFEHKLPLEFNKYSNYINIGLVLFIATFFLAEEWMPLGPQNYLIVNYVFVLVLLGSILGILLTIVHFYEPVLKWCLNNKGKFMLIPLDK